MNSRITVVLAAFALAAMIAAPAAAATTYNGPSFQVTPSSIVPGDTVNIVLGTTSSSTFGCAPSGGSIPTTCTNAADCNGSSATCFFTLQSCPSGTFQYYSIHQISVTDPNGKVYWLGGSNGYSLSWPTNLGGPAGDTQNTANGFGPAVNVSLTDSLTIPFGQGVGGFTLTSTLSNPPNAVSPEGPYYWYLQGTNTPISSSTSPTSTSGTYVIDIEGAVVCGSSVTQFQTPGIFFDGSIHFDTPQFAVPVAAVSAVALLGLVLLRRRNGISVPKV